MNVEESVRLLLSKDEFLILTHRNPDGDTVGSACALCSALRRAGKTAYLYPNSDLNAKFRCYAEPYNAPEGYEGSYTVAVDISVEKLFPQGYEGSVDFCVDHHPTNSSYADELLLTDKAAACGETVLLMIENMHGGLTAEEATLLYLAVSTDTGRYLHGNTNADTFRLSARLYEYGADMQRINTEFFKKVSKARIQLEGMLYSGMRFYFGGLCTVARLTRAMLTECGAAPEDLEDLANIPGRVEGSKIAVFIKELDDNSVKVSVRTEGEYSAIDICSVFGGGGHRAASGCNIAQDIDSAEASLIKVIEGLI